MSFNKKVVAKVKNEYFNKYSRAQMAADAEHAANAQAADASMEQTDFFTCTLYHKRRIACLLHTTCDGTRLRSVTA